MAFVYEKVGEENRELWESIGWKNWGGDNYKYAKLYWWSIDREQGAYLMEIGGFIDMPDYYDLSYKGRIVRMEVFCWVEGNRKVGVVFNWRILKMYIPKSLWPEKNEVVKQVTEAFSVVRNFCPIEKVKSINVDIRCEPECVEADYNGR